MRYYINVTNGYETLTYEVNPKDANLSFEQENENKLSDAKTKNYLVIRFKNINKFVYFKDSLKCSYSYNDDEKTIYIKCNIMNSIIVK